MRLKDVQIRDPDLDKLRPDQLPRSMPLIQISSKDGVPKKILPFPMKRVSLAIVSELGGKYGLDIFRLGSEDASTTSGGSFNGISLSAGMGEEAFPDFKILVVDCSANGSGDEVDICQELSL
jgi:hypothetical protein